jgi:hypothetical protein
MAHGLNVNTAWVLTENIMRSLLDAYVGNGVLSGLAVTEKGAGADMSIDVAAGVGRAAGTLATKGATTNVVVGAADATNPRKDIVVMDSAGTITVVAGTPMAAEEAAETGPDTYEPVPPDIPANKILLAEIWVAAGVTEIYDADISEMGVLVFGSAPSQIGAWGDASGEPVTDDQSAAWYVYGELPAAGAALSGGEVVRGAWERLLVNKAQTNNVSICGSENQLRVKADLAAGVHSGLWAYFEQSGAVTLSGAGFNTALNIAVETDASLTLDAGVIRTETGKEEWADYIRLTPDGDVDFNIIHLGVSGDPILSWDESDDAFQVDKAFKVSGSIGFFGNAPVAQRAKASYNNWAAFGDVVNALVDLKLFDAA